MCTCPDGGLSDWCATPLSSPSVNPEPASRHCAVSVDVCVIGLLSGGFVEAWAVCPIHPVCGLLRLITGMARSVAATASGLSCSTAATTTASARAGRGEVCPCGDGTVFRAVTVTQNSFARGANTSLSLSVRGVFRAVAGPNLFPAVGRNFTAEQLAAATAGVAPSPCRYLWDGKEYDIGVHGFLKDTTAWEASAVPVLRFTRAVFVCDECDTLVCVWRGRGPADGLGDERGRRGGCGVHTGLQDADASHASVVPPRLYGGSANGVCESVLCVVWSVMVCCVACCCMLCAVGCDAHISLCCALCCAPLTGAFDFFHLRTARSESCTR